MRQKKGLNQLSRLEISQSFELMSEACYFTFSITIDRFNEENSKLTFLEFDRSSQITSRSSIHRIQFQFVRTFCVENISFAFRNNGFFSDFRTTLIGKG